jgi:superfamily II DNA or RNA helicase
MATATTPRFARRDYQARIIDQVTGYWHGDDVRAILIESPTGSGKTFMGLHSAQDFKDQTGTDPIVVWVAMREHLLHQVVVEKSKFGLDIDLRPLSMFDRHGREFLAKEIENNPERPVILCLDEAQHDAATSMTDVYQAIKPDYVLGLSATPFRVDKAKLCFEKQIRDAGIHRLISDGYLSKFDLHMLEDWTPESVAAAYFEDPEKWGKSVFYFLTTAEATKMTELLIAGGARTAQIVGGTDYQPYIDDFKAGRLDCLVNVMVLTEGFDCPELQTAWVRPSSRGPTMQMAGRAFRIHEVDGKQVRKNIVQSNDTRWPISRTATPEDQYKLMDGEWRSIKPNKRMEAISVAAVRRTIENYQPLPDFITKKTGKGKPVDQDGWFGQA